VWVAITLSVNRAERGVPLNVVENAFLLAAARRLFRPSDAPPLGSIRSLAYSPVIDEVLDLQVSQDYFIYLRHKIERLSQTHQSTAPLTPKSLPDNPHTPPAWMMLSLLNTSSLFLILFLARATSTKH